MRLGTEQGGLAVEELVEQGGSLLLLVLLLEDVERLDEFFAAALPGKIGAKCLLEPSL